MDGFLVSASISVSVFSCWHFLLTCFVRSLLDSGEVWQNRQSSSPWAPLDCLWASLHHCTHAPLSCHEPPLGTRSYRPWPGLTWALTPRLSKRMWTFPDGEKGWDLVLTSLSYFLYCQMLWKYELSLLPCWWAIHFISSFHCSLTSILPFSRSSSR